MKLWSIQPVEVYENIINDGYYKCDGRYIWESFRKPYRWLISQMKEKIGQSPKQVTYPVWAWYLWNGKNKKPDLRTSSFAKRGTKMVCIELEIPDKEVVLSDYDAWHFVLNNWYLNLKCANEDQWEEDHKKLNSLTPTERQSVITASWNNIFDIEKEENDWFQKGFWVQATFWTLKKEYIRNIQFFTAK